MYPHGFCWHKCIALGNVDQECDHVYLAEVYMHDKSLNMMNYWACSGRAQMLKAACRNSNQTIMT